MFLGFLLALRLLLMQLLCRKYLDDGTIARMVGMSVLECAWLWTQLSQRTDEFKMRTRIGYSISSFAPLMMLSPESREVALVEITMFSTTIIAVLNDCVGKLAERPLESRLCCAMYISSFACICAHLASPSIMDWDVVLVVLDSAACFVVAEISNIKFWTFGVLEVWRLYASVSILSGRTFYDRNNEVHLAERTVLHPYLFLLLPAVLIFAFVLCVAACVSGRTSRCSTHPTAVINPVETESSAAAAAIHSDV